MELKRKYLNAMNTDKQQTETNTMLPVVLICDCHSTEHQMVFYHDPENKLFYCHVHLIKYGFWIRFKHAIKYLLGYKSRYGAWDEFIISKDHLPHLRAIVDKLSEA
jgi:hypothetical protein